MKMPCGCCRGVEKLTPAEIFNRPGLPALFYRMGTHSTLFETMQASLASWYVNLPGPDPSAPPAVTYPLRALTTRDLSDPSIALLDAWAVVGDVLTFYQERIANEGFLRTALHRCSVLELARLIGYRLRPGVASSVFLAFTLEQGKDKNNQLPVPKGTRAQSIPGPGELPQSFETSADLLARPAWNVLKPRLTRPQKITADPADESFGAANLQSLFFEGTATNLKPGDPLLIVCDEAEGKQFLRYVERVAPDNDKKRTEVILQLPPPPTTGAPSPHDILLAIVTRFHGEALDLFPESKVIVPVVHVLEKVQSALGQDPSLTVFQIVEQARLAVPQFQEQLDVATKRNYVRMVPWMEELLREWENFIAAPSGPSNFAARAATTSGKIRFGEVASPQLSGFLGLNALVEKLALLPSVPPASPVNLSRNLSTAFSHAADNLPQLFTGLRSELSDSLYQAWKNLELPPNPVKVYALRTHARLYGHNAPPRIVSASNGAVTKWGEWLIFSNEKGNHGGLKLSSSLESALSICLDQSYTQVLPNSWLVVGTAVPSGASDYLHRGSQTPTRNTPNLQFAKVKSIDADISRADYGMSSKTSHITLGQSANPLSAYPWLDVPDHLTSPAPVGTVPPSTTAGANFWAIRQTVVYAQSEELILADAPIEDDIFGDTIELDDLYDGLKPGRWLIVSGDRSDVPGTSVSASELVMLAGVSQGGQAAQCMNFPSKLIPFSSVFYVTDPNDAGDRLVVGRPSADFQAVLQQLPLPSPNSPNQTYCAPLELAPGFFAEGYVPSSAELGGDFSAFSGLVIDPTTGQEFETDQIPITQGVLPDVFAWRIVSTRDSVHTKIQLAAPLSYTYDPPTVQIYGNVAKATHGETRSVILGSGDASKSLQTFSLSKSPLTYLSAPTPSGTQSSLEVRVNGIQWHEAESLADMQPGSRAFFIEEDHDSITSVTFGDGVHGARVPTGPSNVKAVYRSGIGAPGNVAARQISQLSTRPLGVKEVINPLPATGGADEDTLEQARSNVPIAVMSLDRLVSLPDYAFFTRNYAGVAKSSASRLAYGSSQMVHVTFAAVGDVPVDSGSDFFRNLSDSLVEFGDPLAPVHLARRSALLLVIKAEVRVLPDYLWQNVSPLVRNAMLRNIGFDNRELEQDAVLSEVFSTIQSIEGVDFVKVDAFGAVSDVDDSGKPLTPDALTKTLKVLIHNADPAHLRSRVVANPARLRQGIILPAQIAYLSATVPDCLLLSELKG